MSSTELAVRPGGELVGGVAINYEEVLKALNLNPRDPKVQALVLTCQQYGLDPVLKHMVLISGDAYVTHRGLLHVAHASGRFDGIELLEHGEDDGEWWAKVAVWRNDMRHPFTYVGRYPKSGTNKKYGPEMAITRAESMALRRAFDVAMSVQEEMDWPAPPVGDEGATRRNETEGRVLQSASREDDRGSVVNGRTPASGSGPDLASAADRDRVAAALAELDAEMRELVAERWKDEVGPSFKAVERFLAEHVDPALALIESVRNDTYDRRRKRAMAVLGEVGLSGKGRDDERHEFVKRATNGETESTAELSAPQLAAICDSVEQRKSESLPLGAA